MWGRPTTPTRWCAPREIVEEMLVDKGRTEGAVTSDITEDESGVRVVFNIRDEQQIRIRRIHFEGVEALDDWVLRWAMKKTRESHTLGALLGGSTYTEEQYAEDIENVRQEYLKRGYLDVSFGPPQFGIRGRPFALVPLLETPEALDGHHHPRRRGRAVRGRRDHRGGRRGVPRRPGAGVLPLRGRGGLRRIPGDEGARLAAGALRAPAAMCSSPAFPPGTAGPRRGWWMWW